MGQSLKAIVRSRAPKLLITQTVTLEHSCMLWSVALQPHSTSATVSCGAV